MTAGRARARWHVVDVESQPRGIPRRALVIRDVGHTMNLPTVTNDVESVVATLAGSGALGPHQRLFYFDSEGDLAEIVHAGGRFKRFAPVGEK